MEYHEAADLLFGLRRFRPDPGTATTAALLETLDAPHTTYDCVQIAGTNGKGSTARFLATILEAAGYRVGLYTSPHLQDLRERIQVNGRPITKQRIAEYVDTVADYVRDRAADGESPTFFEAVTGLAFWQFDREDVDIAVLEVGIGGRYDATSVVDPVASAVTNVSLEHTAVLGDSITEIAADKATVAPADAPLVTAATGDALEAIHSTTGPVHRVGTDDDADTRVTYHGPTNALEARITLEGAEWQVQTPISLRGSFQAANAGVAAALARQVGVLDASTLATGLRRTDWPGRVEVMDTDPLVVLDGAHNPGACAALSDAIAEFEYTDCHLVVGAMHDKDLAGMAAALPSAASVTVCRAVVDRAEDPAVLARVFDRRGDDTRIEPAVEDAVASAVAIADADDCVLVCGSLAVVAEARRRWTRIAIPRSTTRPGGADRILGAADIPRRDRRSETLDHHVIEIRAQTPRARALASLAEEVGLHATLSPVQDVDREPVPVVLAGTTAAFDRFSTTLDDRDDGLSHFATPVATALSPSDTVQTPWTADTAVMGIVNVTPDSFYDGGEHDTAADAIAHAETLVDAGADIVDIGGESTRPGADAVPIPVERDRVLPVVEAVADLDALVSIDTRHAAVARPALEAGADIVNDVSGLEDPEMRFAVANHDATVVVMHSVDVPVDPTNHPLYDDVVTDVIADLVAPIRRAEQAGIDRSQIVVDPGLGFGKTAAQSFALLDRIDELHALGCPVMVGHSRKSMFEALGSDPEDRGIPTVAATALAADRGADVVRVHDVAENAAAIHTTAATRHGPSKDTP
ncbi:MAG: dihydropteroate synthase [Halobacteriaceae archaeon]